MTNEKLIFGYNNLDEVHKLGRELHNKLYKSANFGDKISIIPAWQTGMKPIHPVLESIVGVYDLKSVVLPAWYVSAMEEFNDYIDENMQDEEQKAKIYSDVEAYNSTGVLPSDPSWFIRAVEQYNTITVKQFSEKLFPNGQKISKFLKKVCELTLGKEKDHMQAAWAKIIESNSVEKGGDMKIVLTNSTASFIGMGLYLEAGRSCQTFTRSENANHAQPLEANLLDPNSIMLYVTTSAEQKAYDDARLPTHPVMKQRTILRLVEIPKEMDTDSCFIGNISMAKGSKKTNKKSGIGLMIDRSYPDNKYVNEVYELVNKLCEENGLIFLSGNAASQGTVLEPVKFKRGDTDLICFDMESFYQGFCNVYKEKCSHIKTEDVCRTTCNPYSPDICTMCKAQTSLSEKKTTKCSKCQEEKCPFSVQNCCQCLFSNGEQKILAGYKDNSNRPREKACFDKEGKFRDRYMLREVVKTR